VSVSGEPVPRREDVGVARAGLRMVHDPTSSRTCGPDAPRVTPAVARPEGA
jgi:hypothetical protein